MQHANTKQAILDATINLISSKSIDKISIREIAAKAGSNSACISYYFGSKDDLIRECMNSYWLKLCTIYKKILSETPLTLDRMKLYCKDIMEFYFHSKGILRSEQSNFVEQGMDLNTKNRISLQLNAICYMIKSLHPELAEKDIPVKAIRFISSLAHPALWVENYERIAPPETSFDEFLELYIEDLINNI
jgi:Transcriptional regulator